MTVNIKGRTTDRRYDPMQPQRPRSRTIPVCTKNSVSGVVVMQSTEESM